jgi:hypothetical protein
MGNGVKRPADSEKNNIAVARKSIIAAKPIKAGEMLTEENLTTKRPGTGLNPMRWKEVVGTRAVRDFDEDEFTDGVDDLYESKKIRLSEQDITYMVKRVLKEAYNNKKKTQHAMNESRIIKINENMIKQIVETCVKTLLKENDYEKGGYVYKNKLNEELDFKKEQEIANKMVSCLSPEERMYLLEKLNDNSYQDFLYTLMNAVDNNGNWFTIP